MSAPSLGHRPILRAVPAPRVEPRHPTLLKTLDGRAIRAAQALGPAVSRYALGLVFFWFGALKVVGASPASAVVIALQRATLPFFDSNSFVIGLGALEVAIGVLLFSGRAQRLALVLLAGQMATTFLPLVVLPELTWRGPLQLTFEGQYIVKNVVIVALAMTVAARLEPACAIRRAQR